MKKISVLLIVCFMAVAAQAVVVDDFTTTTLSNQYVQTRILDQGSTANVNFGSPSGLLESVSTGSDGAEQVVLLRNDYSLDVGETLLADAVITATGNRDIGICVAATKNMTELVRQDYIMIFLRSSATQLGSSGFDGTSEMGLVQAWPGYAPGVIYIERTAEDTFDLGYYNQTNEKVVMVTRTVSNTDIGNAIGFYTDIRETVTLSGLDNLEIIPEPATLTILALGASLVLRRRKR